MEWALVAGRLLYAWIFLVSGVNHFAQANAMAEYAKSMGVPAPRFMVQLTGLQILLGGASVLLGYQARWGAALLLIFLIATAFIMHPFWTVSDPMQKQVQTVNFFKNLSMAGAALMIMFFGSGPMSLG